MKKQVLAEGQELHELSEENREFREWNQEQEVHARVIKSEPESHREQLQQLLYGLDLKRLVL